jgi:hypothetical protein
MKKGELVIYVDESGSPDIYKNRTGEDLLAAGKTPNHLVIAALRSPDPNGLARAVNGCISLANTLPGRTRRPGVHTDLHAARDDDAVRSHVCSELAALDVKATAIVMDKRLIQAGSPWLTDRSTFYNELLSMILADSLHIYEKTRIVLSHKNYETPDDLSEAIKVIQRRWSNYMRSVGARIPIEVTVKEARASTRPGLQAVDYVAWAVFQAFERGDLTYCNALQPIMRHVWDLGRLTHYSRKKPLVTVPAGAAGA